MNTFKHTSTFSQTSPLSHLCTCIYNLSTFIYLHLHFHSHASPLSHPYPSTFIYICSRNINTFFLVFIINIRHHFHTITHPLSRVVLIFTHTSPFLLLCTSTFTHTATFTQNYFYFLADCLHFIYTSGHSCTSPLHCSTVTLIFNDGVIFSLTLPLLLVSVLRATSNLGVFFFSDNTSTKRVNSTQPAGRTRGNRVSFVKLPLKLTTLAWELFCCLASHIDVMFIRSQAFITR